MFHTIILYIYSSILIPAAGDLECSYSVVITYIFVISITVIKRNLSNTVMSFVINIMTLYLYNPRKLHYINTD